MALFGGLDAALKINASDFSRGLRGAQSTVSGFGRSVGSTFDDVGDEATEMGRSVVGASGGFSILEDSITDVLVPTRLLSGQLDEVGDEASEAGLRAGTAATGFTTLAISSSGLSFSLGVLSTVTTSTVFALGSLLTVIGLLALALAPLVIGAAAVAAAFGLIVGTGIIAGMKELKKAFAQATKKIMPMIKAFGKQFVPFLVETVKMLPGLVKAIFNAIGPLDQFFNALRTLRNLAFKFLPQLIGWFFDLGRFALPILTKLGAFVINKVVPALRTLVKWGKQIWKIVGRWVAKFQQATKKGSALRTKFNKLIAALQRFWKKLQPVLKAMRPLVNELIKFGITVGKVALDVARLAVNLGTKLLPYLIPIINFVKGLVKWFNSLSYGTKRLILVVGGLFLALGPIISILGTLFSAFTTIVSVVGTVIAIFNPLTLAILAVGTVIAGLAYLTYKNWNQIVSLTKKMVNIVVGFLRDLKNWFISIGTKIVNWLRGTFVGQFISQWIKAGKRLINVVSNFLNSVMDYLTGGKGPLSNIFSAGAALIDEFIAGIQAKISALIDTVKGMVGKVRGLLPFSPAKYGPLADLDETGPAFVETFASGIVDSSGRLESAAMTATRAAQPVSPRGAGSRPIGVVVTIQTEDEALSTWVRQKASVEVTETVSDTFKQAKRRGTFD